MAWRAARSLLTLHRQLRPLAPHADPRSWGLKGDEHHDSTSDHAPKDIPGLGRQVVTAADFPDEEQLVAWDVLDAIRASRDPRAKYGISEGRMWSSYPAHGYPAWTWRPGRGHFKHGHLSVVAAAIADDPRDWTTTRTGIVVPRPDEHEEDPMLRTVICYLSGRASMMVKEPDKPLRWIVHPWTVDALKAAGAVIAPPAPTAESIVATFGPLEHTSGEAESIARINSAG